eukprot:525212-Hanusia_phi.AAC.4
MSGLGDETQLFDIFSKTIKEVKGEGVGMNVTYNVKFRTAVIKGISAGINAGDILIKIDVC